MRRGEPGVPIALIGFFGNNPDGPAAQYSSVPVQLPTAACLRCVLKKSIIVCQVGVISFGVSDLHPLELLRVHHGPLLHLRIFDHLLVTAVRRIGLANRMASRHACFSPIYSCKPWP